MQDELRQRQTNESRIRRPPTASRLRRRRPCSWLLLGMLRDDPRGSVARTGCCGAAARPRCVGLWAGKLTRRSNDRVIRKIYAHGKLRTRKRSIGRQLKFGGAGRAPGAAWEFERQAGVIGPDARVGTGCAIEILKRGCWANEAQPPPLNLKLPGIRPMALDSLRPASCALQCSEDSAWKQDPSHSNVIGWLIFRVAVASRRQWRASILF
eukprot:scaffold256_cov261-Pinguiococcus_pyrenoidosus.AAC.51